MHMVQFRGEFPNFGDELNSWLWPKLVPNLWRREENPVFVGIGSMLGAAKDLPGKKIIFGAGFVPEYHQMPDITGDDWHVYFVRGPRTAKRLGLPDSSAISDAGLLVRSVMDAAHRSPRHVSFIPHWGSLSQGNWEKACAHAGINLIDPRKPVDEVLDGILKSRLVIAEAMHGAIISDALRVPWVPVMPLNHAHRDKWYDWAESLDITLRPQRLWPSSLREVNRHILSSSAPKPIDSHPQAHSYSATREQRMKRLSAVRNALLRSPIAPVAEACFSHIAAHRLRDLAKCEGMLSGDQAIEIASERMLEKLAQLKRDYHFE